MPGKNDSAGRGILHDDVLDGALAGQNFDQAFLVAFRNERIQAAAAKIAVHDNDAVAGQGRNPAQAEGGCGLSFIGQGRGNRHQPRSAAGAAKQEGRPQVAESLGKAGQRLLHDIIGGGRAGRNLFGLDQRP